MGWRVISYGDFIVIIEILVFEFKLLEFEKLVE